MDLICIAHTIFVHLYFSIHTVKFFYKIAALYRFDEDILTSVGKQQLFRFDLRLFAVVVFDMKVFECILISI